MELDKKIKVKKIFDVFSDIEEVKNIMAKMYIVQILQKIFLI